MRIIQNPPCGICSPDNVQKHCFSCGRCRIKFTQEITYQGIEYGLCSAKCELSFYEFRFISRRKLYDVKY